MTDIAAITKAQEETAAAFTRIVKKGRPSFGSVHPVSDSLKRLEIGGTLGSGELLRICKVLENTAQVKSYGRHEMPMTPKTAGSSVFTAGASDAA